MSLDSLDDLDKQIIGALAEDGRRPYRDIARELGASEASIRQRVGRLTEKGLIRIAAIGNLISLGFDAVAMIMIKVKPGKVDEYAQGIAEYSSVRFVAILLGNADIAIQSLHNSLEELHEFVRNELPSRFPDIVSIEVFPEIKTIKSSWTWKDWFSQKLPKVASENGSGASQ